MNGTACGSATDRVSSIGDRGPGIIGWHTRERVTDTDAACPCGSLAAVLWNDQPSFEILYERSLTFPDHVMSFVFKTGFDVVDAARVFGIEFTAELERAPVGRDSFTAFFFGFIGAIQVNMPVVIGQAKSAPCLLVRIWRTTSIVSIRPLRTVFMISSTSTGAAITIVPVPQRLLIFPVTGATVGYPLLSRSFSCQMFFRRGMEQLSVTSFDRQAGDPGKLAGAEYAPPPVT